MISEYFNLSELRIAGEFPLLIKLRLRHLFARNSGGGSGVLIVDTCIIGDFTATLPAVRQFIQQTGGDVDMIVSPPAKSFAQSIRGVRSVFTAKSIYSRNIEDGDSRVATLPREYDRVLVLRISPDAAALLRHVRCSHLITYGIPFVKYWAEVIWSVARKRAVRQWREVNFEIAGLQEPENPLGFEDIFRVSEADYDQVRKLPAMSGDKRRVIIHPGSGWRVKLWDNAKWAEVIRRINTLGDFNIVVIGAGEFERKSFDDIQRRVDIPLYSFIDKVDLKTTLLMMRLSDVFIGIDSGPRNLAHLADIRSITLLGPAPKNFMPVNKADVVIDKFTCRCKSLYYFHRVSAIQTATAEEVVDGFRQLLRHPARPPARVADMTDDLRKRRENWKQVLSKSDQPGPTH